MLHHLLHALRDLHVLHALREVLSNTLHSRKVSDAFPPQPTSRGAASATGSARGPGLEARRRRRRGEGTRAPSGGRLSRRRRRLTRIGPARPHPVTRGGPRTRGLRPGASPAPPAGLHTRRWCEKCAPDGVPPWVFAGRRKRPPVRGALFGLLGSTRPFTRGPWSSATPA